MNRDLIDYQEQYANQPYEKYQVAFRKRKLREILEKYKHSNLLEVGCGLESIFLDVDSFQHITVLEPALMFYEKALEDSKKYSNKSIEVINMLLEESISVLERSKFDFVLVSSLLHEISDQSRFLQTLHKITSYDTIIHFNVPNAKSFHRLLAVQMGLIKSEFEMSAFNIQFQQQQVFDLTLLKNIMEKNDFEVIESGSFSFKPFTHHQMQNMINLKLITDEMLDGFYKMERYLPELGSEIFVNIRKNRK